MRTLAWGAAAAHDKPETDVLGTVILFIPLFAVTFLSKFCFEMSGSELLIGVPLILAAGVGGILTGRLKADPLRMAAYMLLAAILVAEQVFAVKTFVGNSLILLLAMPFVYTLNLVGPQAPAEVHLRRFLNVAFIICLLGLAQYGLQFVIGKRFAYPIEHFGPADYIAKQYNQMIPLKYGHSTLKANGVFMVEPSYFSQLLGLALALETAGPRRWWRMALFAAGLFVAYSGTGLILLGFTMLVYIIMHRRFELLVAGAVALALLFMLAEPLGLKMFTDRINEFSSTNSSAYMRYVGGFYLFDQYLWSNPVRALFGVGSGQMFRTTPWPLYSVSGTGWVKMLVEFGLVGFTAYFGYLFMCTFRAKQPLVLRVGVAVTMLLNGILDPWSHALLLSLLLWPRPLEDESLFTSKPAPAREQVEAKARVVRPAGTAIVPVRDQRPVRDHRPVRGHLGKQGP